MNQPTIQPDSPTWLAPGDIQRIMGVAESTVAQWFKEREFEHFKKGRLLRVEPGEFFKFLVGYTARRRGNALPAVASGRLAPDQVELLWQRIERLLMHLAVTPTALENHKEAA